MDKAQKSLVDTYLRKREIAVVQTRAWNENYKYYELRYMADRNIIPTSPDEYTASKMVRYKPELFDKFDVSKFDGNTVYSTLMFGDIDIMDMVNRKDINGNKLDLSKLDGDQIASILTNYQAQTNELADILNLKKIKGDEVNKLIRFHPKLITKVNYGLLSKNVITNTMWENPQMIPLFDELGLIGKLDSDVALWFKNKYPEYSDMLSKYIKPNG